MHLKASMSSVGFHNSKNLGCCFEDFDDAEENEQDNPDEEYLYMADIEAELAETHGLEPPVPVPSKSRDLKQPRRQRPPAPETPALDRIKLTNTLAKLTPASEKSSSEGQVLLPASASLPLIAALMNVSMDVHSIQQNNVTSLQSSANKMALEEIIQRYEYLSGQILSENVAIQLILDLLFVRSTLIADSSPTENGVKITGLIETFRSRIDPDQFDVLEPDVLERVKTLSDVMPGLSNLIPTSDIVDQHVLDNQVPGQQESGHHDADLDSQVQSHAHKSRGQPSPHMSPSPSSLSETSPGPNMGQMQRQSSLTSPMPSMTIPPPSPSQSHNPLNFGEEEQNNGGLGSVPQASGLCLSPLLPRPDNDDALLTLHQLGADLGLDGGDVLLYPGLSHSQEKEKSEEGEDDLCLSQPDGIIVVPDTPYCPHPPSHPEYQLFTYPKPRVKNSVHLRTLDFKTLDRKTWLNCGIIDFYTQYLFYEKLKKVDQDSVLIYESDFLLLTDFNDGTHKMLSRYQNIKIFKKTFLFFPVCENDHWILIVCVR